MEKELCAMYSWVDARRDSAKCLREYRERMRTRVGVLTSISMLAVIMSINGVLV